MLPRSDRILAYIETYWLDKQQTYFLSQAIFSLSVSTIVSRKAEVEVYPFWVELLIGGLPFVLTLGFWIPFGFSIH